MRVTQFMESLVADNEALKRDIAELQNLLTESREDVRILREEIEEAKANGISAISGTPHRFEEATELTFLQRPQRYSLVRRIIGISVGLRLSGGELIFRSHHPQLRTRPNMGLMLIDPRVSS